MALKLPVSSPSGFPPVRLTGPGPGGSALLLRPPRPDDWQDWAELRGASRHFLAPWEPIWPADGLTRSAFQRRLRRQSGEWRNDAGYALLVFEDGALAGGVNLSHVRRGVAQSAMLGYWLGEASAGRGLMSHALIPLMDYAFATLGLHRVEAACLPRNAASRRVLEKLGFGLEGTARGYLKIAGVWEDHLIFGLLADDWDRRADILA